MKKLIYQFVRQNKIKYRRPYKNQFEILQSPVTPSFTVLIESDTRALFSVWPVCCIPGRVRPRYSLYIDSYPVLIEKLTKFNLFNPRQK